VRWLGSTAPHSTQRAARRAASRRRAPSENHAAESARIRPFGPTWTDAGARATRRALRRRPKTFAWTGVAHRGVFSWTYSRRRPPREASSTNDLGVALFVGVFVTIVVRQVVGRGPPIWAVFLAGAGLTVASGVLSPRAAGLVLWSELPTLAFLLALFVLAEALDASGAIRHLARWLIGQARRPTDLPLVLFVGFGLVSTVLVNDAAVLIGVPLLIAVAARLRTDPKPLLLVLAFSVTVGSVLTPFGNPQNLLVALASGFTSPVTTFLRFLALPTAVSLVLGGLYLRSAYRRSMPTDLAEFGRARAEAPPLLPTGGWGERLRRHPVLWAFPGTLVALVALDVAAALTSGPVLPIWVTALVGAAVVVVASPGRLAVVRRLNWSVLLLFVGLFVVVAGGVVSGVLGELEAALPIPGPGHTTEAIVTIVATSLGGAQLVSNVPWVALQIPVLGGLGYTASTPVVWVALAAGSTLAGNVTLLGAASNLILVEAAAKRGVVIRLGEFVRRALPVFAISVAVLLAFLLAGL
jgi:Na+/H+ antiporter NhaD/arsenite permease-like protein